MAKWQSGKLRRFATPHFLVLREIFEKNSVFEQIIQEIYRTNPILSINRDKIGVRGEKKAVSMVFCSRPTVFP